MITILIYCLNLTKCFKASSAFIGNRKSQTLTRMSIMHVQVLVCVNPCTEPVTCIKPGWVFFPLRLRRTYRINLHY